MQKKLEKNEDRENTQTIANQTRTDVKNGRSSQPHLVRRGVRKIRKKQKTALGDEKVPGRGSLVQGTLARGQGFEEGGGEGGGDKTGLKDYLRG